MSITKCLRLMFALALLPASLHTSAATRFWTLSNVQFDDGAIATGYFSYDDAARKILYWNLSISRSVLPAFTYLPDNSAASAETHDGVAWLIFTQVGTRPWREVYFRPPKSLDGSDTSVSIASRGEERLTCEDEYSLSCGLLLGPRRRVVAGSLSLNPVNEFYNTILDHYFLTADLNEAINIDAGGAGPGWIRTGHTFKSGGSRTVCRFRGVQAAGGPNGHFYTADPAECERVKKDPGWLFESLDFSITPKTGPDCPDGLVNIYRAYNNRSAEHDSNHRITADFAAYRAQVVLGWSGEGVVMCAEP